MTDPFYVTKTEKLIWSIKRDSKRLKMWIHSNYIKLFRIKLTEHVLDTINGIACEIEYRDKTGKVLGYWAYGSWHPNFPYYGQY